MQRRVTVADDAAAAMLAAARAAWPREVVGLAGGRDADGRTAVAAFLPLPTTTTAHGAFAVDAAAFAVAEAALRARGLALVGFVHSHPLAAPHPSRADCAAAWPDTLQLLLGGATPATLALRAFTIRAGVAHSLPLCIGEGAP